MLYYSRVVVGGVVGCAVGVVVLERVLVSCAADAADGAGVWSVVVGCGASAAAGASRRRLADCATPVIVDRRHRPFCLLSST